MRAPARADNRSEILNRQLYHSLKKFNRMRKTATPSPKKQEPAMGQLSRELALLQTQRNQAITECDFAKARAIDCHIDRLKEEIEYTRKNTTDIENELAFDMKREEIRSEAARQLQNVREEIYAVQNAYQLRLMELHRTHSDELVQFAEQYAAALELESTRSCPDALLLQRQAQFNAKNRDYGAAEYLFEQSNQTRVEKTAKMQDEVQAIFEKRKARIVQRHKEEDALCIEKQEREIEVIENEYGKKLLKLRNVLAKKATDLGMKLRPEDYEFLNEFALNDSQMVKTPKREAPATPSSSRKRTPVTPRSQTKSPRTPVTPKTPKAPFRSPRGF